MKNKTLLAGLIVIAGIAVIALTGRVLAQGLFGSSSGNSALTKDTIIRINVEGPISGASVSDNPFEMSGGASSIAICEDLYRAADDPHCVGVVLRVNSPGGSAAASDEIFQAIKAVREANKPVVVSMGDVAASGGYYVAAPADHIFVNPSTLTGSIGVIFNILNWEEAAEKLGISDVTLHAGEYKDIGSPWRGMSDEERGMLESMLTQVHEQFITAVAEGRTNLSEDEVRALATGMIYTGQQAVDNGLADELGGLHAAEEKARQLAGAGADVPVEGYGGGSWLDEIFSMRSTNQINVNVGGEALADMAIDPLSSMALKLYMNPLAGQLLMR